MIDAYIIVIIAMALIFDFLNGMNDAANSIATVVSTRVLTPLKAVAWAAFFNFIAAFGFGVAVALTIGKGIVDPKVVTTDMIFSALMGAVIWTYFATHYGLPISVSHALIGGLIGTALVMAGPGAVVVGQKLFTTIAFIAIAPMVGMAIGFLAMVITLWVVRKKTASKVDKWFRRLQLCSAAAFSYSHGTNDAQKTMGIIVLLLFTAGFYGSDPKNIYVPIWVILMCHAAIGLGTLVGGWNVIKTMGMRLTKLRPVHGFCAETSGAITIIGCSLGGIPLSTTHTITGSIMGVGATRRLSGVKWGVARNIVWAWILTIPLSAVVGGLAYLLVTFIRGSFF
jgi:PiT family inorganic phosphate transporter